MKKFWIILLALCFVLPSFALGDTNDQIVFHGIPWGISLDELVTVLGTKNISVPSDRIFYDYGMPTWNYNFRNSYEYDIPETGHEIVLVFWDDENMTKIAGYPVRNMSFYAHYDITNGVLDLGTDNCHYYMADVWFDVNDEMAVSVYDDLHKKLTALYGTGTEDETFIVDTTYTYTVWKGADNTAVCLYRSKSKSSDYQFVNLVYGITNIKETLLKVREAVIEHQVDTASDDTTGL